MTMEGDQTRERLLTAARDLYLEEGLGRFSLREVARRAAVSAPAVYRHFDGKEALLRAVCVEGFRIFATYLMRSLAAATAEARLYECIGQYLRFGLEHPHDYRFIFMTSAEDAAALVPPTAPASHERDPTFQFLIDRVRDAMDAGVVGRGDLDETAAIMWAHVHGLVSLRLSGHLARAGNDTAFRHFYMRAAHALVRGMNVNTVNKKERA